MDMQEIFARGGLLAQRLPRFEPRTGQLAMAEALADLLADDLEDELSFQRAKLLVVEAETGIGKTLAYLIPAILSGRKIVISTATLNLQDQILSKELPLVEKVLGIEVPALCIKGRQNYLCHYRWFQHRTSMQMSLLDDTEGDRIEAWLEQTETGDRAELAWLSDRSALWPKISAQSSQCLGGDCPESASCFLNQLRRRAGAARLLIVNHHLFFSDLALRSNGYGEVLPRYEGVIFDEAHHIENVATQFFGRTFSQYQLLDLFADIEQQAELDLDPAVVDRLRGTVEGVRVRIEHFVRLFPEERGRYHLDSLVENLSSSVWKNEIDLISAALERLRQHAEEFEHRGEGWTVLARRINELRESLEEIAFPESGGGIENVHWYERRERAVVLSATPVEVAGHLQRTLYQNVRFCVMTSATLSSAGSFAYVRDRLGLDDATEYLHFDSPFDYRNRTLLYVPESSFPEPTARDFQVKLNERVLEILHISRGRALVLFTSFRAMEAMADFLDGRLDYPVLVQGRASRQNLLKTFSDTTDSVLLAVASFWEGVDVPGESLSCVIIDKLPFEVPTDPVLMARIQIISDNGGKPFFDFQVPRAILSLRQGVGRLMRAASDRGVIAIMDVRLFSKGYGRTFLKSLPPSPVVRYLDDLTGFFNSGSDRECTS
jgi:ATP-dependent DNA helicase DinG